MPEFEFKITHKITTIKKCFKTIEAKNEDLAREKLDEFLGELEYDESTDSEPIIDIELENTCFSDVERQILKDAFF
jgi:hypothetical protein